jgi:hypothetical protein
MKCGFLSVTPHVKKWGKLKEKRRADLKTDIGA